MKRFINSKCDRCGKSTPARQNGEHDLFTLPEDWGYPFRDIGSFCQSCIDRYNPDQWAAWLTVHRPYEFPPDAGRA